MIKKKNRFRYGLILGAWIIWLILCPEIFWEDSCSCIKRTDGKTLSQEEAQKVWDAMLLDQDETTKEQVLYKSKILEWLQENYQF